MSRIAVLGAGAWGTALALHAARQGHDVALWARSGAAEMALSRRNPRLPDAALPASMRLSDSPAMAMERADFAILAVPVQHMRAALAGLPAIPMLVASKGVEAGSGLFPTEILDRAGLGVISGPHFAAEVAAGLPAAGVLASSDAGLRQAGLADLEACPGVGPALARRIHDHFHPNAALG